MKSPNFWPDEQQLVLLHAVLDDPSRARAAAVRWLDEVEFEGLDAGSQRLLPMLYQRLKLLRLEHQLGPRIAGFFRRCWYMDQRLRGQLRIVRAALRGARIDCILLKGTALGADVYGHGALRPADDMDLLVRPGDFHAAADRLVDAGWRLDWPGDQATASTEREGPLQVHALTFTSDIAAVDLHISPFHEIVHHPAIEGFWADRRSAVVDGAPANLLSRHDQLLHTFAHGMRVNPMPPIRWIADAVCCIRAYGDRLDWNRFALRAEQLEYTVISSRALDFLVREFAVPAPSDVIGRLAANPRAFLEWADYYANRSFPSWWCDPRPGAEMEAEEEPRSLSPAVAIEPGSSAKGQRGRD